MQELERRRAKSTNSLSTEPVSFQPYHGFVRLVLPHCKRMCHALPPRPHTTKYARNKLTLQPDAFTNRTTYQRLNQDTSHSTCIYVRLFINHFFIIENENQHLLIIVALARCCGQILLVIFVNILWSMHSQRLRLILGGEFRFLKFLLIVLHFVFLAKTVNKGNKSCPRFWERRNEPDGLRE